LAGLGWLYSAACQPSSAQIGGHHHQQAQYRSQPAKVHLKVESSPALRFCLVSICIPGLPPPGPTAAPAPAAPQVLPPLQTGLLLISLLSPKATTRRPVHGTRLCLLTKCYISRHADAVDACRLYHCTTTLPVLVHSPRYRR